MSSTDNLRKQFGLRSGPLPDLNPNCSTLIVFLKEFSKKFENNDQKKVSMIMQIHVPLLRTKQPFKADAFIM